MIYELGSWQHFVKRQDNIGLPIMEIKQKYLMEISKIPIDLLNINGQGGGSITVSSTPEPPPPPPPPELERYLVEDCITGDQLDTQLYEIGDFEINDRVTFISTNGSDTFGKVIGTTEMQDYERTITATGVNSIECFDNYVVLSSYNGIDDTRVSFAIELASYYADFISSNEYAMTVNYVNNILVLVYVDGGEGEPSYTDEIFVEFSGSPIFNNYFYEQEGDYEIIYRDYTFPPSQIPIEFYNQEIFIVPSFENTNGYGEEGCPNNIFFRNSGSQAGSSFNMSFRNDNC